MVYLASLISWNTHKVSQVRILHPQLNSSIMEEKLDLIIQKLDELLILARRIHKDTEPSIENNASEYLLNVLGDVTGDVLMQGLTGNR